MTLHPSQLGVVGASTSALKTTPTDSKKSSSTSFASVFKDAQTTAADTAAPAGETTKAVEGHNYADILTGSRKGMYLNTGHNKRAGQAFVLVRKNGREYHIYGTGKDRVVIGMKIKPAQSSAPAATTPTTPSNDSSSSTPTGTTDTGKLTTDTTVSG